MRPLMEENEIVALEKEFLGLGKKSVDVLEWGSGGSTVYFVNFLRNKHIDYTWTSIEYNPAWREKIAEIHREDEKVEIHLVTLEPDQTSSGAGGKGAVSGADEYVRFPSTLGKKFDFILVDGRYRRRCLLEAKKLLKPGGVVFLHDADRRYYHCAFSEFGDSRFMGKGLWRGRLSSPGLGVRLSNGLNIFRHTSADPFLRKVSLKLRTVTGRRTKKIVRTFSSTPIYLEIERDVREGGAKNVCILGTNVIRLALTLGARNRGVKVTGVVDTDARLNEGELLNRFRNVSFIKGVVKDMEVLFAPGAFDYVLFFEVLELTEDVDGVLDSAVKVLKEGGAVGATLPTSFITFADKQKEFVGELTEESIRTIIGPRKGLRALSVADRAGDVEEGWDKYWNYFTFRK